MQGRQLAAQKKRDKRIEEGKTGLKISEVPQAAYNTLENFIPEPTDVQSITEGLADLRKVQKGISLGAVTGSIVGEYLPLPKGTGSVLGGAVGYGISRGKRYLTNMLEDVFDKRISKEVFEMAGTGGQTNDSIVPNVLQATGSEGISSGFKRYNWKDLNSHVLWDAANKDKRIIDNVQSMIDNMDSHRQTNIGKERPMTGYIKKHGKPTFFIDDKEWGIGWSRKRNNYEIFDVQKRIERRAARLHGDKVSNPESASLRAIKEAFKRDLNIQSKTLPSTQWDVMIQNPGDAYIEHLISVKSPFWKSTRGKNIGYLAGDSKNLKVLADQNFKTLKDNIEKHVHKNYKDLYVDYDPITQNLVLKNIETGEALPTQIPGFGRPSDWRKYIDDTISDREMQSIVDVSPSTPANVQRQIDSTYFNNLDPLKQNAIADRINGYSWKEVTKKYGKKLNREQIELLKKGYAKLTKTEVNQIIKAYRLDGKGAVRYNEIIDEAKSRYE